jgi:uncharacterized protein (DUF433 family)
MTRNALVITRTVPSGKPLGFYTSVQASRIACVPEWTLGNWRRNGIIIPTVKWIDEVGKEHPGHSFETVVFMRLLRLLREKNVSLYKAVDAMQQLKRRFGSPSRRWADAKIFVDSRDAYVYEEKDKDRWGTTVATRYNQRVADFILGEEFVLLKERADALLIPSQFMGYVEIDPAIQNGLPIVLETKILTSTVHDLNSQGYQAEDIHNMYPFIPETRIVGVEEYETFLDKVNSN